MTDISPDSAEQLQRAFEAAGQDHVFRFLPGLDAASRERLMAELHGVDLALLQRLIAEMRRDDPVATLDLDRLAPAPYIPLPVTPGGRRKENRAIRAGQELLREGKVAAFVVAGGQGSRLGFEGPKGCFPVGPVTRCTLFEWHFSKVLAARRRYEANIPMLVLTSHANHEETRSFLAERQWFGLPEEDVILFRQGMLPAVDRSGRLLMSSESGLAMSPDGHGGSLRALAVEGVLEELERRNIEELFYFQIDNPLVKILDPAFLGHHRLAGSQMSSKVVLKRSADEKVGVFARSGRKLGIVEYSDLPDELSGARDEDGKLLFAAGNIAIHILSTAFVRQLTATGLKLPFHRASKAVPHVNENGVLVTPAEKNGVKFETFVFDALPLAKRAIVVEAERAEEFSPVKNARGEDSPETSRRDLVRLFRGWIEAAGFSVADESAPIEISPLYSLDREQFVTRIRKEKLLCSGGLLLS